MTPAFEEKQSGFSGILLWISAGMALFMFLGLNALWGSESHWAEVAREMFVTGDFLHPAVNWQILRNEPLFAYWETVPFIKLFGADELAVRLPVAITALFGLFGAFALAKKLFDRSTALLSSWMLLSTYGFLFWGRTASAECLGMTSAILAVFWYFHAEEKSPWFKYPVFYLFLCAGASVQGVYAALVPVVFLLPHLLSGNRWSRVFQVGHLLPLLTAVLLYTLPFYLAWIIPPVQGLYGYESAASPLTEFFSKDNLLQIFSVAGGGREPLSCLLNLPRLLLPWLPFFVVAVVGTVADWKSLDRKYKEFWLGILLLMLFFTLNPPRRWSYILPLVPFCCVITSAMLYRKEESRDFTVLTKIMYWVVVFAASLAFAAPVMLPVFQIMFKKLPPPLVILSLPLAGFAAIVICIMDNEPGNKIEHLCGMPHRLVSSVVGMAVLMAAGLGAVRPGMTVYRTGKPFIKRLLPHIAGIPGENIVFYETDSTADFHFYLRWNGPAAIVRAGELAGFLRRTAGEKVAIVCVDKAQVIDGLKSVLTAAGISEKFLVPTEKESGTGKNWTLFVIDVPAEADGQPGEKLSADNDKMQQKTVTAK